MPFCPELSEGFVPGAVHLEVRCCSPLHAPASSPGLEAPEWAGQGSPRSPSSTAGAEGMHSPASRFCTEGSPLCRGHACPGATECCHRAPVTGEHGLLRGHPSAQAQRGGGGRREGRQGWRQEGRQGGRTGPSGLGRRGRRSGEGGGPRFLPPFTRPRGFLRRKSVSSNSSTSCTTRCASTSPCTG